jgi:hydroxymethylpyrimidine pyrophosphatase-like HAD family hydrolase
MSPTSAGPIVLFDLDETLIDRTYSLNVDVERLRAEFRAAIAQGAVLGLNSDTPLPSLKETYDAWGLNGPIVAERGAQLYRRTGEVIDLVPHAADFQRVRQRFVHELSRDGDVCIRFAQAFDLEEVTRNAPADARLVVIHPYRERSLSFWTRRGGRSGDAAHDPELLQAATQKLSELIAQEFPALSRDLDIDRNLKYCICVMTLRATQKTAAVKRLLDEWPRVFMIGNSMSDWIDSDRVIHGAVANADDAFKQRVRTQEGGRIAQAELTEGAIELLRGIVASTRT